MNTLTDISNKHKEPPAWLGFWNIFSTYGVCTLVVAFWASQNNVLLDSLVPAAVAACAGVYLALGKVLLQDVGRDAVAAGKVKPVLYYAMMAAVSLASALAGIATWKLLFS